METNEDKLLEKLVDIVMKDSVLETPSIDFAAKVMSQVQTTKNNEVYHYKPLISKYLFILFFGSFIVLFIYLSLYGESQTDSWYNNLNFKTVYNYSSPLPFNLSKGTIYSVVIATLMLLIQISFLKKHFNNQLDK